MAWLRPFLIRCRHLAVKHAPEILMGMGTAGSITAVILAVKAAPAAKEAYEHAFIEKNDRLDMMESDGGIMTDMSMPKHSVKLKPAETVKACGKYFIPAAGLELFSLLCFWGAHGIDLKRQALLAGLYSTAEQALIEYQRKVVDMIGEKPEKEIRAAVAQDHMDQNPPPTAMLIDQNTDVWCYYKGYKFRSSYLKVKEIQNEANEEMISNLYLSESDLLWMFDPERHYIRPDADSRMIGWSVDNLIYFDILPTITPDHQPAFEINIRDKDGREYRPKPGFSASL